MPSGVEECFRGWKRPHAPDGSTVSTIGVAIAVSHYMYLLSAATAATAAAAAAAAADSSGNTPKCKSLKARPAP